MSQVIIREADDRWPDEFVQIQRELRVALGEDAQRIDHIGSTSVPGLPSKDVIDVQVTVEDEAMLGRTYITPLIAKGLVDTLLQEGENADKSEQTSLRQREVLQLLAEGKTMKQIAAILGIKPRTVAFHKYGMMKQLGAKSTADLIKIAVKLGVSPN